MVDPSARAMTLAQWADLGEDDPGELADGRIVEDEEIGAEHDIVGAWLIWALRSWLASRSGFVGMSDTRFGVSPTRGRKPDTYVYLAGRRPPRRGLVTVPPDIMVEVVSPRPKGPPTRSGSPARRSATAFAPRPRRSPR